MLFLFFSIHKHIYKKIDYVFPILFNLQTRTYIKKIDYIFPIPFNPHLCTFVIQHTGAKVIILGNKGLNLCLSAVNSGTPCIFLTHASPFILFALSFTGKLWNSVLISDTHFPFFCLINVLYR